jgi:hypothetical protein
MMEEEYIKPPGMLLSSIGSKRLIAYVYPLLLTNNIEKSTGLQENLKKNITNQVF